MFGRRTKRQTVSPRERLGQALELPAGLLDGGAQVIVTGGREVLVDGCRGVLACESDCVRLHTGTGQVCISGQGLLMRSLTERQALIEGTVATVTFTS